MIQLIKMAMVACIAFFFSLMAFGNITDYQANWQFVEHVLTMDTTFQDPHLMWHAIRSSGVQHIVYGLIIAWEVATALLCWWGAIRLLRYWRDEVAFRKAKTLASFGLFMGFLLYMVGFVVIGGEWFAMWQSSTWNGQMKAGLFVMLIMFVLIFLQQED